MNNRQTILQNEKLKNIHNYLMDIYKATCSGYTNVSLSALMYKNELKSTYSDATKAVTNLNLVKSVGAGRSIKYFWAHNEYPTMDMANRINVEMNRLKTNRELAKSTDKMIEGRNLVPIIKTMSDAVQTLHEPEILEEEVITISENKSKPVYYIGVVKMLQYHKVNPVISFAKTVKNFNVPPMLTTIFSQNDLLDENRCVKQDADADTVIKLLKGYWSDVAKNRKTPKQENTVLVVEEEKPIMVSEKPIMVSEKPIMVSEKPIMVSEKPIMVSENIDLSKITKNSDKPVYYNDLVKFLNCFKEHILANKKLAAKTFGISPELVVCLKEEHYTETGLIKPEVTPELCIELMREKFKTRKSRSKTRSKIVENDIKKQVIVENKVETPKFYSDSTKKSELETLINRYELNPNTTNLSIIRGYLYAKGHLSVHAKIELKEIEYIKKNIFGQRILKTRMQTMDEYILEIAKKLC